MNRTILYTFLLSALCSCTEKAPAPQVDTPDNEPVPIVYGVTRALGENAPPPPPADEVFTFISYRLISGVATEITNYYPNAPYDLNKHQGFYTYLPDGGQWKGIMQPCSILEPNTRWSSTERAPQQGQALVNGNYMSVCLRPGVELVDNGAGSQRMLITRNDERYASAPFNINVQGYQVFALPEPYDDGNTLPLHDLRSKVWFDIIRGTDRPFSIVNPRLINAGFWGWYHPLLQTTLISYEAGSHYLTTTEFHYDDLSAPGDDSAAATPKTGRYSIYDRDDPFYQNATSIENLTVNSGAAPTDGTGTPDTFYGPVAALDGEAVYTTGHGFEQGIFFFANNYRTSDRFLQPGIYFELEMGEGDNRSSFKINIPFDIDMKPNHAYLFRLTVESSVIRVHYRTAPWEGSVGNGGEVGGDYYDWVYLGLWSAEGWQNHNMNGGDEIIGDE